MSSNGKLEAATQDRKARLAALRGIKRKAPETTQEPDAAYSQANAPSEPPNEELSVTKTYLSGRNYDPETRGPKLGFESAPDAEKDTLEVRAAALELQHKEEVAKAEEEKDAPIDLFKLQPKKPNWDLKRDLRERAAVLDVRTKNAIARLVRERLEGERKRKIAEGHAADEVVALEGGELLEAVNLRERQDEEERRREREEDEADGT
jgi:coiled-coil domain-containing protein 12